MTYEAAILYAQQRMREIGKSPEQYHFEPVQVSGSVEDIEQGKITLSAYNELYILVNPDKYYGVFIKGDNSGYSSDLPFKSGVPEFTGFIIITRIATKWNLFTGVDAALKPLKPIPLEFIRVVIY